MTCQFCGKAPTIKNSHVVPNFIGKHIKRNTPFGYLLNSWTQNVQKHFDIHKGPYLCADCDNNLFSSWEAYFANHVWRFPLSPNAAWTNGNSLRFLISLAFRYAIHFVETSPISSNLSYSKYMRDLTGDALRDETQINSRLYIYPYVHRAISGSCALLPGINHFLTLSTFAQSLPHEPGGDLPNSMLVVIPKVLLLVSDRDLNSCTSKTFLNPISLTINGSFDPMMANQGMPEFLHSVVNRAIGQGLAQQKNSGLWKRLAYGTDKNLHPQKICYTAQQQDRKLQDWQQINCKKQRNVGRV